MPTHGKDGRSLPPFPDVRPPAPKPPKKKRGPKPGGKRRLSPFTPRLQRFLTAYLRSGNASQAAREVGHRRDGTANRAGHTMLHHSAVQEALKEHLERYKIDSETVLGELARLGFANLKDYQAAIATGSLESLSRDVAAGLTEWDHDPKSGRVKLKLAKVEALDKLGRFLKLFVDRVEVTGLEDLAERIEQARKKLGGGSGPAPAP